MKEKNFDNPNTDEARQERADRRKKGSAGKAFLTAIGLIAVAVAVFIITVKVAQPDANLTQYLPKVPMDKVSRFVEEKVRGIETTEASVTEETTQPVTEPENIEAAYLPIEEFAFNAAAQGNFMGNILAGGKVATDLTYIYHIADGRGIYRFAPESEGYTRVYETEDTLSSLNLRGDYIYYVNESDHGFYRMKKGEYTPELLAKSAKTAYVYDNKAYLITTKNTVAYMQLDKQKIRKLYVAENEEAQLIGISLNAVFFTLTDGDGNVRYMTVDLKKKKGPQLFRASSAAGETESPVLENGYLYYYEKQDDDSYNLCRQKFGAQKAVTLVEDVTSLTPPVADANRLYYGELDGKRFKMMELNMNNSTTKTLLFTRGARGDNTLTVQHGVFYDFIIGKKSKDGDKVYSASCIDTGSGNIMWFEDGSWTY